MRLFEIARELNYSLTELNEKAGEVGLIANTPFSLVPPTIEEKIRKEFKAREENKCLSRQKPKVKRVKKKTTVKKAAKKVIEDNDIAAESGTFADLAEESFEAAQEMSAEVIQEEAVEELQAAEISINETKETHAKKAEPTFEPKGPIEGMPAPLPTEVESLGRVTNKDEAEDSFTIGRIVAEGPKSKAAAKDKAEKKKKKRSREEKQERRAEWNNYGAAMVQPLPKKNTNETKGTKLQRMQLVYGHELPKKQRKAVGTERTTVSKDTTLVVTVPTNVRDLSETLGVKSTDVIKYLMTQGHFMTITDQVDQELGEMIAMNFEIDAKFEAVKEVSDVIQEMTAKTEDDANLVARPPVITIMGHVDHGKTSLLDKIRESNLTDTETGGITQHIGGYQVEKNGHVLSFLDTPGHAAFTSMRARGANITDIVVLVVAADDGMMPQTEEAINHAKSAGVPIVVAINKMDLEAANPNRIKEQLAALDLIPEEWSGTTPYVPVSAHTGEGIDDLLEMINLQAELLELKADPTGLGEGTVIEAQMETGRGVVASVLVGKGKMKKGDPILCGRGHGWMRTMEDENGKSLKTAGPSKIIKVMGLSECPVPGDQINVMPNIKKAKSLAEERQALYRNEQLKAKETLTMENLMTQLGSAEVSELKVLIKGDVQGSVEALDQALSELGNDEVKVGVIHKGIGAVSESDILLAKAASAIVIAFRVSADAKSRRMADKEGVEIRKYGIIYELLDELTDTLEGMLSPDSIETQIGEVEVREVFRITNVGNIAGCYVKEGYVERNMPVKLIRDGAVVYSGKIQALRRFKDDVKRVETRYECGIRLENYDDIRQDDIIETYNVEIVQKKFDQ